MHLAAIANSIPLATIAITVCPTKYVLAWSTTLANGIAARKVLTAYHLMLDITVVIVLLPCTSASPPYPGAICVASAIVRVEAVDEHFAMAANDAMIFVGPRGYIACVGPLHLRTLLNGVRVTSFLGAQPKLAPKLPERQAGCILPIASVACEHIRQMLKDNNICRNQEQR